MKLVKNSPFFYLIILFVSVFILRLLALSEISNNNYFNNYAMPNDSFFEIRGALEYIFPYYPEKIASYLPDYGYKSFINHMFSIFGDSLSSIRIFQLTFSLLMIFPIYYIGKMLGNKLTGSIAAFFWAFSGEILLYDLLILKYSLTFSLTILTMLVFIFYLKNTNKLILFLLLILIFILSLFRIFYIFLIFYLVYIKLKTYYHRKFHKTILLVVMTLIICSILCWLFYAPNSSKTHIGIHMYKGFNKNANGFYLFTTHLRDNTLGHFQEGIDIGTQLAPKFQHFKSINNFWLQKTIYFIFSNPLQSIKLILLKFYNSFFFKEWNDTVEIEHLKSYSFLHKYYFLSFPFLVPFAFVGIYYTFKHFRENSYGILLIFLFIPLLSILLTCLTNRYQSQLIPILSVYAGLGCKFLYETIKLKKMKSIIFLLILIIFLLIPPYLSSKHPKQIFDRLSFLKYKLEKNSAANKFFIPFIKNEKKISFMELKQTYDNFIMAENTLDAIGLIKKYSSLVAPENENEKIWLLESIGNAYFNQMFYKDSINYYKKILDIEYREEISKKIKTAQYLDFLKYSVDSYP